MVNWREAHNWHGLVAIYTGTYDGYKIVKLFTSRSIATLYCMFTRTKKCF